MAPRQRDIQWILADANALDRVRQAAHVHHTEIRNTARHVIENLGIAAVTNLDEHVLAALPKLSDNPWKRAEAESAKRGYDNLAALFSGDFSDIAERELQIVQHPQCRRSRRRTARPGYRIHVWHFRPRHASTGCPTVSAEPPERAHPSSSRLQYRDSR